MQKITFSFGKNWQDFLKKFNKERIKSAELSLTEFLNFKDLKNKSFLDIGCGSGIFSYAALRLGSKQVVSFDMDPLSVECCKYLHKEAGSPTNWTIYEGSILNSSFLSKLGKFDIVYSFGVLHHTGKIWEAIKNSAGLVNKGGYFYVVLYNKGRKYKFWLRIKKLYNSFPSIGKRAAEIFYMAIYFIVWLLRFKNPLTEIKNYKSNRGMDWKTDIIDWLGGYPYEPTTVEEVFKFIKENFPNFNLLNIKTACNSGGDWYLFRNEEGFSKIN